MDHRTFEFTLSLPGDPRLVDAVRDLTTHAATYAKLEAPAAEGLATQVVEATRAAIAASGAIDAPVDVRFVREDGHLRVSIGLDVVRQAAWPVASGGRTVDTRREGARETCLITQPVA